jgi:hypothetical protein
MRTIMILYVVIFSVFPTGFQEYLHIHIIYKSSYFSTRFFENSIYLIRCSNGKGEYYNTNNVINGTDRQPTASVAVPAWRPFG